MKPLEVDSRQRDALYEEVVDHLSGSGDVLLAIERNDPEQAARLAQEFSDDLIFLLNDLGFDQNGNASLQITTEASVLRRLLPRLSDRTLLADQAEAMEQADICAVRGHGQLVRETCDDLLTRLAGCM